MNQYTVNVKYVVDGVLVKSKLDTMTHVSFASDASGFLKTVEISEFIEKKLHAYYYYSFFGNNSRYDIQKNVGLVSVEFY